MADLELQKENVALNKGLSDKIQEEADQKGVTWNQAMNSILSRGLEEEESEQERTLEEILKVESKVEADYIARRTLKELLKVCEAHDISKDGFIREIMEGIDPEKDTGLVVAESGEFVDLDLEEIAVRGEKRIKIKPGHDLSEVLDS